MHFREITVEYVAVLCVEIKYYSVAFFNHVTAFKVPFLRTFVKGGAQTRCVIASIVAAFTQHVLSPALNGSSEIRHFERSDTIELRNGTIFDFYTGLPHMLQYVLLRVNLRCMF